MDGQTQALWTVTILGIIAGLVFWSWVLTHAWKRIRKYRPFLPRLRNTFMTSVFGNLTEQSDKAFLFQSLTTPLSPPLEEKSVPVVALSPVPQEEVSPPVRREDLEEAIARAFAQVQTPRVPGGPPAPGTSPWDAVFHSWLVQQSDLDSSWYRKVEVPSGTAFVFIIPKTSTSLVEGGAIAQEETSLTDPEKTEVCPRKHAITDRNKQGSYCPECAAEGHKYPGQSRPGQFRSADYSIVKGRRRYGIWQSPTPITEEN